MAWMAPIHVPGTLLRSRAGSVGTSRAAGNGGGPYFCVWPSITSLRGRQQAVQGFLERLERERAPDHADRLDLPALRVTESEVEGGRPPGPRFLGVRLVLPDPRRGL